MVFSPCPWPFPPPVLALQCDQVHVWWIGLDLPLVQLSELEKTLSPDEKERSRRFHFRKDRDHYVAARGALRDILSRYMRTTPERLFFTYSAYGKPSLSSDMGGEEWRFNLSHSHGLALVAVTRKREVGIDVEYIREDLADEQIARRFFSAWEVDALATLPLDQRSEAFFNCWTRKEAYIKARGEGLSIPLDQFDVTLAPGEPAALLATRSDSVDTSHWTLRELSPSPGYAAAVAVQGEFQELKVWHYAY